jgi:chemotaxis signal transduction protein
MSGQPRTTATRSASELAHEFDRSFADPARATDEEVEELLAIRVAGDAYAVRLRDVTGLVADRKIVPLPTPEPALLGIVGLRNGLAPVYNLAALLGYGPAAEAPRWLLLVGPGPQFGLAFPEFDGHRRVARAEVSSNRDGGAGAGGNAQVPELVRIDDTRRGLIDIAALIEMIRARVANHDRAQDHTNEQTNERTKES